ncbi:SGNH/GDSL hydrolase family protein [Rathayibacter sp. VKM Ac-2754]|uniref:SGNH/GDSL hydrolase family protein n=1 Tax=Rathayibacter sp. VKM Ac-2754 TaxID=2609251 RepID=UPI0013575444|nr:SGNH/GDSL hydrolase family protein [Rathayibacter sp. VKM Ac-2754]MWV60549.1 SGNH/GDSL hydrolase family protein [Rathayibacter sp. VKM Ac-2754]
MTERESADTARRFVAIGDSFTEGVGDPHARLPNGVRGWADRVADRLARAEPGWEYANLAIRSKRLGQIRAEQLPSALELRPTLVTLYAGGNDILDLKTDMRVLVDDYECLVDALATTGASLVLFTGFDIPGLPAPRMFVRRNRVYNAAVRRIARERGATLVDYWRMQAFREPMMWSPDRMHLSKRGHRFLAARVLDILGVPHTISAGPWEPPEPLTPTEWLRDQHRWTADWLLPLVGRKIRRVTLGDHLAPRWPDPVVVPPKGGLRRLARDLGY